MSWLTPPLWEFRDIMTGEQAAVRIDRISAISAFGAYTIIVSDVKTFMVERPFDEIRHRWRLSLTLDFPLEEP